MILLAGAHVARLPGSLHLMRGWDGFRWPWERKNMPQIIPLINESTWENIYRMYLSNRLREFEFFSSLFQINCSWLTASTQGINLESLFFVSRALFALVKLSNGWSVLLVHQCSSLDSSSPFFKSVTVPHPSWHVPLRWSDTKHPSPLARFLCVVIGTSSLHRPTWLGGSRATCSHFFTVFLLTHHSLSFEKAKQGGQVVEGILGRYG